MKRYCTIILLIASLFSMWIPNVFSETESYADFEYEVLKQLNIATGEVIYEPDAYIARKDFAVLVANLRGFDGNIEIGDSFTDIDKNHYAAGSITYLHNMGVLNGYGDNTFRGEELIMYAQAVSVIEALLGYKEVAQAEGGWITGFVKVASNIGLNKGLHVSAENPLTQADAMKLLYNALNSDMCKTEISNGNPAMKEWLSLNKINGIVKTVGNSTTTNLSTGSKMLTVESISLRTDDKNYSDSLGKYCEVYYRTEDDTVVASVVVNGRNDITEIKTEDVLSFDGSVLSYAVGNSSRKIKISASDDISVNGEFIPSAQRVTAILESNGIITINEINNEKIVMVESFDTVFVTSINKSDSIIYGKFGKKIDLKDAETLAIYDENGKETDFTSILADDVLTVKQNSTSTAVSIKISKDKIDGIYNGNEINDGIYTISGTQYPIKSYKVELESYKLTPDMVKNEPLIEMGSKITVYLDSFGRIANIDVSKGTYAYGYIYKVTQDRRESDEAIIRLFTLNDEFIKLNTYRKINIDGERADGYDDIITKLGRGTADGSAYQLVRYTVNDENKINKIDTLYKGTNESKNSLRTMFQGYTAAKTESQKLIWKPRGGSFESKVLYDGGSSTKFMTVPKNITGDTELFIIGKSLSEDDQVCFNAYASMEGQMAPDVLLAYIDNTGGSVEERLAETRFGIITEMKTQLNSDDEIETTISLDTYGGVKTFKADEGFNKNNIMAYSSAKKVKDACKEYNTAGFNYSADAPYKLSVGDFVELTVDSKDKVIFTRLMVSARDGKCVMDKADAGSVYNNRFVFGPMYKIEGSRFCVAAQISSGTITDDLLRYYNVGSSRAYRVMKSSKKVEVEKIDMNDIIDYKSADSNADNVLVYSSAGMTQIVVAYEK